MTMGQWGTHFGRYNTWWEQSRPWISYVSRSQYLLQQGNCVADVLCFAGEAAPNNGVRLPDLKKKGYDYDAIGTDLIPSLTVKDGLITTPCGVPYKVLVLPNTRWMTPALARKVRDLAQAGATIIGPKPNKSPSLPGFLNVTRKLPGWPRPCGDQENRRWGRGASFPGARWKKSFLRWV